MDRAVIVPCKYRHFKGEWIETIGVGEHTETKEKLVIYRSLDTDMIWARPVENFLDMIETENGLVERFSIVGKAH